MPIIRPSEPFPNLADYEWDKPELIGWFHQLSFTINDIINQINNPPGPPGIPVSFDAALSGGAIESEGFDRFMPQGQQGLSGLPGMMGPSGRDGEDAQNVVAIDPENRVSFSPAILSGFPGSLLVFDCCSESENNTVIDPENRPFPYGLRFLGFVSSAAAPTTTELPSDRDLAIHKNTTLGTVNLAFNDGGTIKTVSLV